MALTDSLRILITANGAQAEREFGKVGAAARRSLGQAETSTARMGRSLTSAGVAMATFGGVALVGLYKAAQAADEENLAIEKLNTAFANSPVLVGQSTEALLEQAAALQDSTKYADDATINMQAMLATFRVTSDEIETLTPLVQDLASFWGTDLESAAKAVGKAMQGNIGALSRQGIVIDEAAFAADRYSAVIAGLRENAGGFAAQEGETFAGQLAILKNNLGDVAEGLGQGVLQAVNQLVGPVQSLSDAFQNMNPESQALVGQIATFGAVALTTAGGVSFLAGQVLTAVDRFKQMAAAVTLARTGYGLLAVAAGALAYYIGRSSASDWSITGEAIENASQIAVASSDQIAQLADEIMRLEGLGGDFNPEEMFRALINEGPAGVNAARALGVALIEAGYDADVINDALWELRGAAFEATGGMEALEAAERGAGDAASRLSGQWGGLDNALNDFNAALSAQQALYSLQDALAAAQEEGGITGREMVDLNQSLSSLVQSYVAVAEANNTAADGSINFRGRNAELRQSLGALAAFIPAELRPQFNALTRDIMRVPDRHETHTSAPGAENSQRQVQILTDKVRNAPRSLQIAASIYGAEAVIDALQRMYQAAVNAANAIGQTGGSLAGGGTYSGGAGENARVPERAVNPRSGPALTEAGVERAMERALDRAVQKTVVLNGA